MGVKLPTSLSYQDSNVGCSNCSQSSQFKVQVHLEPMNLSVDFSKALFLNWAIEEMRKQNEVRDRAVGFLYKSQESKSEEEKKAEEKKAGN